MYYTSDLPNFRALVGKTFLTAGLDFAGPVFVKDVFSRDMTMHKAYITLTKCAPSRTVNLELVPDLSTPAYIRAQRRLIARKGYPEMASDNGLTFCGKELNISKIT